MTNSNINSDYENLIKQNQMDIKDLDKKKLDSVYAGLVALFMSLVVLLCYTTVHNELAIVNSDIHNEITILNGSIQHELNLIHNTLDKIDQRFDKIDQRFDKMDQRFDKMEERFMLMDSNQKELNKCILLLQNADVKITGVDCNLSF